MHFQPQINTDEHRYKQKPKRRVSSAFICVYLWLIAFPVSAQAQETITVAVASSLYPAMQQQAKAFEAKHDITVRLVPGSTGRLYNQIVQGAPFDVFIAADAQRPAMLAKQGRVLEGREVGQGYLGVMLGHRIIADPGRLTDASVQHIVIANPDVAPFGKKTRDVLQRLGLWQQLKHKFVYAQNAMQASMMVNNGLVDAGFVPLESNNQAIARIQYQAVLLTDRSQTRKLLRFIRHFGTASQSAQAAKVPGTAEAVRPESGECTHIGGASSDAQIAKKSGAAKAVLPKVQTASNQSFGSVDLFTPIEEDQGTVQAVLSK